MPRTIRTLTRGEESLVARLKEEAVAIAALRLRLRHHRRLRDLLIGKARHAGFTVREIERMAGVSNVRVSQLQQAASVQEQP